MQRGLNQFSMNTPSFIIIGAQKAGSTWLYSMLNQHPAIGMPIKEFHYFNELEELPNNNLVNRFFDKHWLNIKWRHDFYYHLYNFRYSRSFKQLKWGLTYFLGRRNAKWYGKLFKNNVVSGEATPNYSALSKTTIKSIHQNFPRLKIILLIRNPIDRSWSNMRMIVRKSHYDYQELLNNDFFYRWLTQPDEKAFLSEFKKIHTNISDEGCMSLIKEVFRFSNYNSIIRNWLSFYPKEQLFIGFYDDIKSESEALLEKTEKFLGIDSFSFANIREKKNANPLNSSIPANVRSELEKRHVNELHELLELDIFSSKEKEIINGWIN